MTFDYIVICLSKCNPNTCHSMTRRQGGHLSFYACSLVCRRRSPWPPQWIPILEILFCFMQTVGWTNERTDERTNERTNVLFWRRHGFAPRSHVSSPALSRAKRGNWWSSLVFSKSKPHSSNCEGCPYGFVGVCGGRTTTISYSQMRSDNARNNEQRRQRPWALISLYQGQTTRIWMAWHFVALRSSPRPPRSSVFVRKEVGKARWRS